MFDVKSVSHAHDAAVSKTSDPALASDPYGLDFNGDSRPEIMWRAQTSGETQIWQMEGEDGSQYHASVEIAGLSRDWDIQSATDFNLDGHQDLLVRNIATGQNQVWFMGGENGTQKLGYDELTGVPVGWEVVGTGDFNQDGRGDLLWRHQASGQNTTWHMGGENGTDIIGGEMLLNVPDGWKVGGTADFNRDGKVDILWRNHVAGENVVWYMGGHNGAEIQSQSRIMTVDDTQWSISGAADFNGDGAADILWRNESTGGNVVWYMGGADGSDRISGRDLMTVTGPWQSTVLGWKAQPGSIQTSTTQTVLPPVIAEPPAALANNDNGFNIRFDYRFDNLNWFSAEKKAVLESAADIWEAIIQDEFEDVKAGTTVHASNPINGQIEAFTLDYDIDDLVVFAFANDMGGAGGKLAEAGATTYGGSDRNTDTVFQPWLGEIEFDINEPWHLNSSTSDSVIVPGSEVDMLSVAVHELGHILGISSSIAAFKSKIDSTGKFAGQKARELNHGEAIPLDDRHSHIEEGFEIHGHGENALDPQLSKGTRKLLTALDVALLDDIGYDISYATIKEAADVHVLDITSNNQAVSKLQAGGSYQLRWEDNFSGAVKIELYNGSQLVGTIDQSTDSDGQYSWQAPAELADSGRYFKLKVTSLEDDRIFDFSHDHFTIESESLLSGSTFNNSALKVGGQYNLVWNDNLRETVKIELYQGDSYVRTLTASTASDGSYQWTVPSYVPTGEGYRMKLTSTNDASVYNFSDTFVIRS